jgi:transposase-like protein
MNHPIIGCRPEKVKRVSRAWPFRRCPYEGCRGTGVRKRVKERTVQDLGLGGALVVVLLSLGFYQCRKCKRHFTAEVEGIRPKARFTDRVRAAVVRALVLYNMAYERVREYMALEFGLELSIGFLHACFQWALKAVDLDRYVAWAAKNFSGVLCIDEVHEGKRTILFATDPLNDFTVAFRIIETNDQEHMNGFLQYLKDKGVVPAVVITDGSPLYKEALFEYFEGCEHQLCVFHALKDLNEEILRAYRRIAAQLLVNPKHGRGRPRKRGRRRKVRDWRRRFANRNAHLIIKRADRLTDEERKNLVKLFALSPKFRRLRDLAVKTLNLFAEGVSKTTARRRRTLLLNELERSDMPDLFEAFKRKLAEDKFECMITFLGWRDVDRTSNHVERNNRSFRMIQKTRYRRRRTHTIEGALTLDLLRRQANHPRARPSDLQLSFLVKAAA